MRVYGTQGQGIGFKFFGAVVDRRLLKTLAAKLVATISAAVPVAIAYSVSLSDKAKFGENPCDLTDHQHDLLLEVARLLHVADFYSRENQTQCSFEDISLAAILRMRGGDD
jgi:hypothetical protein